MKTAPMTYVRVIHSFMPQRQNCTIDPLRTGCSRSAAHTPIWHVTDDSTRIVVFGYANVRLSFSVWTAHSSGTAARTVKYMANRPAKNMSSLASQTIVPTVTGLGRLTVTRGTGREAAVAVDTRAIMADECRAWVVRPTLRSRDMSHRHFLVTCGRGRVVRRVARAAGAGADVPRCPWHVDDE